MDAGHEDRWDQGTNSVTYFEGVISLKALIVFVIVERVLLS